jgi:hypothetical protein
MLSHCERTQGQNMTDEAPSILLWLCSGQTDKRRLLKHPERGLVSLFLFNESNLLLFMKTAAFNVWGCSSPFTHVHALIYY